MHTVELSILKTHSLHPKHNTEGKAEEASLPMSWYPILRSKDLKIGQVKLLNTFDKQWIIFRNYSGQAIVHARYCCHMGVDLVCAKVVGENLMCPLHQWEFDTQGKCVKIPSSDPIPRSAKQSTLPCEERYGIIFVFWGNEALFELPCFPGLATPMIDKVRTLTVAAPYESITLNGFDAYHFKYVHNREIISEPMLSSESSIHLAVDFVTKVMLQRWTDYLTRLLGFKTINMRLDCWGGNLIMVSNDSTRFRALLALVPTDHDNCRLYFVGAMDQPKTNVVLRNVRRLQLRATSYLGKDFLKPDIPIISGMRPKPGVLLKDADRCTIGFWQYWKGLPRKTVNLEKRQAI